MIVFSQMMDYVLKSKIYLFKNNLFQGANAGPAGGSGGVSSILVLGGSGDYFEVADTVIAMDLYVPADVLVHV